MPFELAQGKPCKGNGGVSLEAVRLSRCSVKLVILLTKVMHHLLFDWSLQMSLNSIPWAPQTHLTEPTCKCCHVRLGYSVQTVHVQHMYATDDVCKKLKAKLCYVFWICTQLNLYKYWKFWLIEIKFCLISGNVPRNGTSLNALVHVRSWCETVLVHVSTMPQYIFISDTNTCILLQ